MTVHLTDLKDEMELYRSYLEDLDQQVLSYRALLSKLFAIICKLSPNYLQIIICNPIFPEIVF